MYIEVMSLGLGTAVHGVMLGRSADFHVPRIIALHSGNEGHSHAGGEVRILTVGFLAAAPARVAKDVDVGRPEVQALVAQMLATTFGLAVLGAAFVADRSGYLMHQMR